MRSKVKRKRAGKSCLDVSISFDESESATTCTIDTPTLARPARKSSGPFFTRIVSLLDSESRMKACQLLGDSISSVGPQIIAACVYSTGGLRGHHTWGVVKRSSYRTTSVVSSVVFRKCSKLDFIELTYIATAENHRSCGHGSTLLSHMLTMWREEGWSYVFTFADSGAVQFFASHGFSSKIPVPRDMYQPWMDMYSQSVLMCCPLRNSPHRVLSLFPSRVKILVSVENVDRQAAEVWVDGSVVFENETELVVQYSAWMRSYTETVPINCCRIRYESELD